MVPSSPPLQDSSGFLAIQESCPSPLSFCPICLISARFSVFSRPPPVFGPHIVCPPSSVRRKATNPPAIGRPMPSSVYLTQRPICRFAPPPLTCAVGGTWLGCWWRGEVDGAPRDGLESLVSLPGVARVACLLQSTLEFPLDSCNDRLSVCPPPPSPFPRTTVLVSLLSLLTEDYFCGRSARPCPAGPGRPDCHSHS